MCVLALSSSCIEASIIRRWCVVLILTAGSAVSCRPTIPWDDKTPPHVRLTTIGRGELSSVTSASFGPLVVEAVPFETYWFFAVANDASGVSRVEISMIGAQPAAGELSAEREISEAVDRLGAIVSADFPFGRHLVVRAVAEDYHGNRAKTPAIVLRAPFHVYIVNHHGTTQPELPVVSVVDPTTNSVIGGMSDNLGNPICEPRCGGSAHDVAYRRPGLAVVTHAGSPWAYQMETGTLQTAYDTTTTEHPHGLDDWYIAIPPSGTKAFIVNLPVFAGETKHVTVLDLNDAAADVHHLDIGDQVVWLEPVASPDGLYVVAAYRDGFGSASVAGIAVIDPVSETVTNRIPLGRDVRGLAFGPSGAVLYASRLPTSGPAEVVLLEPGSWVIRGTIPLPPSIDDLYLIGVTADERYLYATVRLPGGRFGFAAFDVASRAAVLVEPLPGIETKGRSLAVAPDGSGAWYSSDFTHHVVAVSLDRGPDTTGAPVFTGAVTLPFDVEGSVPAAGPMGVTLMPALYHPPTP